MKKFVFGVAFLLIAVLIGYKSISKAEGNKHAISGLKADIEKLENKAKKVFSIQRQFDYAEPDKKQLDQYEKKIINALKDIYRMYSKLKSDATVDTQSIVFKINNLLKDMEEKFPEDAVDSLEEELKFKKKLVAKYDAEIMERELDEMREVIIPFVVKSENLLDEIELLIPKRESNEKQNQQIEDNQDLNKFKLFIDQRKEEIEKLSSIFIKLQEILSQVKMPQSSIAKVDEEIREQAEKIVQSYNSFLKSKLMFEYFSINPLQLSSDEKRRLADLMYDIHQERRKVKKVRSLNKFIVAAISLNKKVLEYLDEFDAFVLKAIELHEKSLAAVASRLYDRGYSWLSKAVRAARERATGFFRNLFVFYIMYLALT